MNMEIRLRALEPEDLDFLYEVENDIATWDIGNTTVPYSHDLLRQYILTSTGDIFTDRQVRLVITADSTAIGIADLTSFDPKNRRAEVGIIINKAWRDKGFATKALQLLVNYAVQTVHLHQLYAIIPESNEPSKRLFTNAGFDHAATLKDWIYDGKKYGDAQIMQKII